MTLDQIPTGKNYRNLITLQRSYRQQKFLDSVGKSVRVIRVTGYVFFGTTHFLEKSVDDAIATSKEDAVKGSSTKFIILDMSSITGLDFSATEMFKKLKIKLGALGIKFIFCGLGDAARSLVESTGIVDEYLTTTYLQLEPKELVYLPGIHQNLDLTCLDLSLSLELCENALLHSYSTYVQNLENSQRGIDIAQSAAHSLPAQSYLAVSFSPIQRADRRRRSSILTGNLLGASFKESSDARPDVLHALIEAFSHSKSPDQETIQTKATNMVAGSLGGALVDSRVDTKSSFKNPLSEDDYRLITLAAELMQRQEVGRGTVLWDAGGPSDCVYLVATGELEVQYFEGKRYRIVETLLRGSMVGGLELLSNQPRYVTPITDNMFTEPAGWWPRLTRRFGRYRGKT